MLCYSWYHGVLLSRVVCACVGVRALTRARVCVRVCIRVCLSTYVCGKLHEDECYNFIFPCSVQHSARLVQVGDFALPADSPDPG